jgi:spermidine dehydrogenase
MKGPVNDTERGWLGLDAPISRRDFLNGSLAGAGSALALSANSATADTFTGYGGVGDYSLANGNTWPVVQAAHRLRDGGYSEAVIGAARDAGHFDLVVVGGGIAGLSAAHRFRQLRGASARILILENHAMPGGEAKQNEFDVEGIRLLGPQGSNDFGLPGQRSDSLTDTFFEEFALPHEYQWQRWDSAL